MSKTRLIEAVKHLDRQETKEILEAKPELLTVWNDQGRNLLHRACGANYKKRGRTALHIGIEKEYDPALLKWLVQHGASPDIADREGITARLKASRKRNKKFFAALR